MNWTVRDLLCWQWFLILCKLPLFTFLPSSLMSNLYVLNSISRDCGSMRPIQSEKMDDAASMVWWVVKYRVGWLSWHYSYFNPSSRKALFDVVRTQSISVWNPKLVAIFRPMYHIKPHCLAYSFCPLSIMDEQLCIHLPQPTPPNLMPH